jgi:hypothetical protein
MSAAITTFCHTIPMENNQTEHRHLSFEDVHLLEESLEPPENKNWKKVIILGSLFFLGFAAVSGLYLKKSVTGKAAFIAETSPQPYASPTAVTMNTFVSSDKSFRFEYPSNWSITDNVTFKEEQEGLVSKKRLQVWELVSPDESFKLAFDLEMYPKKPLDQLLDCDAPFVCQAFMLNGSSYLSNFNKSKSADLPNNIAAISSEKFLLVGVVYTGQDLSQAKKLYKQITSSFTFSQQ